MRCQVHCSYRTEAIATISRQRGCLGGEGAWLCVKVKRQTDYLKLRRITVRLGSSPKLQSVLLSKIYLPGFFKLSLLLIVL